MNYRQYTLPKSFVEMAASGQLNRTTGVWDLKNEFDAYGNHLETELGEIYIDQEKIEHETADLTHGFEPDGFYGEVDEERVGEAGFIPDIVDFEGIVCFGTSGDGAPFCFDFRDNPQEPSVIWWDDIYWRRIAPDFESFIELFDLAH